MSSDDTIALHAENTRLQRQLDQVLETVHDFHDSFCGPFGEWSIPDQETAVQLVETLRFILEGPPPA